MTDNSAKRITVTALLQVTFFCVILLYFGRNLFVPICYGLLIAIVIYPVCKWLERHHWPRSLAITAGLLIISILVILLIALLIFQVNTFRQDLPVLLTKIRPGISRFQEWMATNFDVTIATQDEWWQNNMRNMGSNAGSIIQMALTATAGTLFTLFLVPVYAALFLYNRQVFVQFLTKIIGVAYKAQLPALLTEIIHTYFNFIKGMVLVYVIVGILNSAGLMALGVPHAILFGMLTAIMTIIPYVGIIISALLPISVAWITMDSAWYPLAVIAWFAFVQYLEANVIFPAVVATQIKVSTWATLVAIITGGLLWGISGMILFIPFVGILKIVVDYVPEWGALNILLARDEKGKRK